ncbi:MAG: class I SAM-dependent methyltransferase [Oscillospiraceae bacterium]|nr:class I SAM-dependent methyltransferase [Oscillospiraceae bacterium]
MEIYVYGTGCGAGDLVDEALPAERVAAFVERDGGGSFLGRPVIALEDLAGREIDLLIVTSRDAERIEGRLRELGADPEKVFYLKAHLACTDRNRSYGLAARVLGEDLAERIRASERLIRVPLWTAEERIAGPGSDNDYVRLKTLEAICRRLGDVPGAAAELGVYRGGFARWINALLPERKLYLFDTFEGFDPEESAGQGAGFTRAHQDTSVRQVLAALPHPEQAQIRPGLFPRTAEGLEGEHFALVSLDVDLEESTLRGLRFFLPRISTGGYLLLHDYDAPKLPGVRRALERYEEETGRRLHAVPICDVNGSLVISV